MPEYLAPGVYVEETSFRSKSIEGVSTSTAAFVGPTRRGPFYDPQNPSPDSIPGVLTSFAEFERIYGGLRELTIGTNYLAHAVKAYFENGGARLYVSRVFQQNGSDGRALSAPIVDMPNEADETTLVARMPGSAGNGRVTFLQVDTPATKLVADRAPPGSVLRLGGGDTPATVARLVGRVAPPFVLPDTARLLLTVGATTVPVEIKGQRVEVVGEPLADSNAVEITAENAVLTVSVDDLPQQITLPTGTQTAEALVEAIDRELRRGDARLTNDGRIAIASDRRGTAASVSVGANPALGFEAAGGATEITAHGQPDDDNNVADVANVTADELNHVISAATGEIRATLLPEINRVVLTSTRTGEATRIGVGQGTAAENTVAALLGFEPEEEDAGESGAEVSYFRKVGTAWLDANDQPPLRAFNTNGTHPDGASLLTLSVAVEDADGNRTAYDGLGFDQLHPRFVGHMLSAQPTRRAESLGNLFAANVGSHVNGLELRDSLFPGTEREREVTLRGGNDGLEPTTDAYARALKALDQIDDVSIVAAPGGSAYRDAQGIANALITHAERRRAYRIAVLDTPPGMTIEEARDVRSRVDSKYAAIYFPWVVVPNPLASPSDETIPREIALPPSGFICGIYARNDIERGVYKAPANEVVRGALRFETDINFSQQEVLNPLGVNCLRFFPGRGYRVWGARTASSDPEWKYVNVRRYFNYLERSIDVGTQWAVFEANGERLWANIRDTLDSFLYNEWTSGALLGASPKEAFFVRCDRSTMTQNDLDNGRLVCLIGVAALKPAEFVIFRIGQTTADARS